MLMFLQVPVNLTSRVHYQTTTISYNNELNADNHTSGDDKCSVPVLVVYSAVSYVLIKN